MRIRILLPFALLGSCAGPPPNDATAHATELAGRLAGAPKDCLPIRTSENLRIAEADRSTLVYGSGAIVWANHVGPGCRFGANDIPVFEPFSGSYCRGDIVRSIDRYSHIPGPSCVLGDFVPYTRP